MQMSEIASFFQLQANRLFTIQTPLQGMSEVVLVDFHCTEALSQNFEIRGRLASQDRNIELKKLIGQPVTITLQLTDALASSAERYFHGYVAAFTHLDNDGGLASYSVTILPWLWMLSRRRDIRIFQEENTETILSKVFQEYGHIASFEFRLSKATSNRSYCTQYKETDLVFVERLMQEDGLFFYFEHEKTGHKLIITDTSITAKPIDGPSPSLQYSQGEAMDDLAVVTSFQALRQLESDSVGLKTFDYKSPHARRLASGGTEVNQGDVPSYEVYDYLGEHGFADSDRGEELTLAPLSKIAGIPAPQIEAWDVPTTSLDVVEHAKSALDARQMKEVVAGYTGTPAGLGAVGRAWTPRLQLAGTYDETWHKTRWPYHPVDHDFHYWNSAPTDQQIAWPAPGLEFELANLALPEHTRSGFFRARLPGHRALVALRFESGAIVPLEMKPDTILIDTEEMRVSVTWRTAFPSQPAVRVCEARFELDQHAPLLRMQTQPAKSEQEDAWLRT